MTDFRDLIEATDEAERQAYLMGWSAASDPDGYNPFVEASHPGLYEAYIDGRHDAINAEARQFIPAYAVPFQRPEWATA